MPVENRGEISERSARIFDDKTGGARSFLLAFRDDHWGAFFDGLADEFVSIGFFTPQCHEHAIPLHSPRVIRDAFHRAIKCPDDLANWNRGDKSFELHGVSTPPPAVWRDGFAAAKRGKAFKDVRHWLRPLGRPAPSCGLAPPAQLFELAPRESLCESAPGAEDRDIGQPFQRRGKRSVPQ